MQASASVSEVGEKLTSGLNYLRLIGYFKYGNITTLTNSISVLYALPWNLTHSYRIFAIFLTFSFIPITSCEFSLKSFFTFYHKISSARPKFYCKPISAF